VIRAAAAAALAAGLLGLAGCAGHPHIDAGTALDFAQVRAATPLPAALTGGPRLPRTAVYVVVTRIATERPALAAGALAEGEDAAAGADDIAFDPRVVGDELVQVLRGAGLFEDVVTVGEGLARPSLDLAKEQACAAGASFLIQATIEQPTLRRTERSILLPTLVWITLELPNMWMHSHSYELAARLRLRLHDLHPNRPPPERRLPDAGAEDEFNFFERTSSVWTYLLTYVWPPTLLPIDENKVARHLAALAVRKPVEEFFARLADDLQGDFYKFAATSSGDGPQIQVAYPPTRGETSLLLGKEVRYAATVFARAGSQVSEVVVNGQTVFPTSRDASIAWAQVPVLDRTELAADGRWTVVAKDAAGRQSVCEVRAVKCGELRPRRAAPEKPAPAPASALPPPSVLTGHELQQSSGGPR
jgi:hypothetical protein